MIQIIPLTGLPEIRAGDDLPLILAAHLTDANLRLFPGDVLVVTQKIVSKAEGRFVDPASITPSPEAVALSEEVNKDPALVELVLRESSAVVRKAPNILITRHRLGHVMANSGIDASNIGAVNGGKVLLLPEDPDASAARIAKACAKAFDFVPGVVISDSFGRPWRMGTTNVAIGVAGMPALVDQRGEPDRDGRIMQVTQIALGDAVAAAAGLAMGEGAEGIPAAIVRGVDWSGEAQTSSAIVRPQAEDLFR
ncbi:MAG: coenzyme F420-0:L-glutamate ligase [Sphingomonadaceae bacterium]|jgi:coenzyme F420-0:L-glutamate ligase/coenzyme F420-1:gamma-L-glutamate ligase|nr:coenzyme F420-0:L-glutamate ligase [Sphingomonadaceae bacterium]